LYIGIRTLCDRATRGYGDHSPLARPKEEVTHGGRGRRGGRCRWLEGGEVEEGGVVHGERGPRRGNSRGLGEEM